MAEKGDTPDLDGTDLRIAVVVARFNQDVTRRLLRGAQEALQKHGVEDPDVYWVPGSLELPVTALALAEKGAHDAIVCLGAVIRGEAPHFDHVAGECARGLQDVALGTGIPVAFGVLTTEDMGQALSRAGGKHGNKGWDAAMAAMEMASVLDQLPQKD